MDEFEPLTKEEEEALERGGFNPDDSNLYENQTKAVQMYRWMLYKPSCAVSALKNFIFKKPYCNAQQDFSLKFYWATYMTLADTLMLRHSDNVKNLRLKKTLEEGLIDLDKVIEEHFPED